jgi:hypothetical protein
MTEAVKTGEQEQPPPPVRCEICQSTEHPTGNHNGTDPQMSPSGNHNGTNPN